MLPQGWDQVPLADFITLQRGFDLPYSRRRPGNIKVLSSGESTGFHNEARVQGPGFVVGRATNLGRPTWSDADYWPLNTVLYAKDLRGNDPKFAYYWFMGTDLSGYNSGSVQPMLNRNYIAQVPIMRPPLDEQRAIAATLGALDNKIESNRRATDIIGQLRRAHFRAWRQAHVSLEPTTFGAFADVYGGATPRTTNPEHWEGELTWVTPTDVTALDAPYLFDSSRKITEAGLASCAATLHPPGTILMTSRATIGAFALNQVPAATNQGFIAVRPREPWHRWFLFEEMQSRVPEFIAQANGSTFLEISRGRFKALPVEVPKESALQQFDAQLAPLHAKAAQLQVESRKLSGLRDTLLPELLSGRIRVTEARDTVETAVGAEVIESAAQLEEGA
ncbi:MAG: restriction endonuclease subunit S [Propionibacteriaceae bacterium]|nr:restriction endonuclease subunit S [Propionibacteriaceae bacterium]